MYYLLKRRKYKYLKKFPSGKQFVISKGRICKRKIHFQKKKKKKKKAVNESSLIRTHNLLLIIIHKYSATSAPAYGPENVLE